jgi:general secretion pathway protein L
MKLRIFLPPVDRPDAATRFGWMLFDNRRAMLREGTSTLEDVPRAEDVEAVLPAARVLFARLKLPKVNAATIRELLPFAVEDRLLADPGNIHAVAGHPGAPGETVVAVIDREWLRAMLDALTRFGINPQRAWPESCLLAGGHGDWNLVWGERRGMLVDDDGVSATFDHDASGAYPLALRLALDEAATRGDRPSVVRVHNEGGIALPDLARWTTDSGMAFTPGTQWEMLARAEPSEKCIDLLQGEFAPGRARGGRLPRVAVLLAVAIAALQVAFVTIDAIRLRHEKKTLEAQAEMLFRTAFPEARVVVDPVLQMQRNLADLKRTRGMTGGDGFLGLLSEAAQQSPQPAKSIEFANGKLVIHRGAGAVAEASK